MVLLENWEVELEYSSSEHTYEENNSNSEYPELSDSDDQEKKRFKLPSLSRKKNPAVEELEFIFDKYGYKSKQFCEHVKSFIFFVIRRYHGEPTEDLTNNCYLRLFELLSNFNRDKGNLPSFIFSICRNEITKYQYRLKKIDVELFIDVPVEADCHPYLSETVEFDFDYVIQRQQFFNQFDKIMFSDKFVYDYSKDVIQCNLVNKVVMWEKVNM